MHRIITFGLKKTTASSSAEETMAGWRGSRLQQQHQTRALYFLLSLSALLSLQPQ
jgi:hypothetical protein